MCSITQLARRPGKPLRPQIRQPAATRFSGCISISAPGHRAHRTVDGIGAACSPGGLPTAIDVATERSERGSRDRLPVLWPERLAGTARSWVIEHIHDGVAGAAGRVGAHVDLTPARRARCGSSLRGHVGIPGSRSSISSRCRPCAAVDGTASFDRKSMELRPRAGASSGFKFRPAR